MDEAATKPPAAARLDRPTAAESLDARIGEARSALAYRNFERARAGVLHMQDLFPPAGKGQPSAYWREELQNIEYMLDASPLVVERLRHHCFHVTGVWPYRYRSHTDRDRWRYAEKLAALTEIGGRELFVPESRELGGFGFDIGGDLVNIDTLKFYEALVALSKAGALDAFRRETDRRFVWEIGVGWGGFAYQFKTLFPNTTYVITDLPELFLFSGTYLPTLFPDAEVIFWDGGDIPWDEADFVFVPNTALGVVSPPRLDLTINMVSFQEMTTEQVSAYVDAAHRAGSELIYSLNRDRSPYNPELTSVREILAGRFAVEEMTVLPVSYVKMLDRRPLPGPRAKRLLRRLARAVRRSDTRPINDYAHLVGRRRVGE